MWHMLKSPQGRFKFMGGRDRIVIPIVVTMGPFPLVRLKRHYACFRQLRRRTLHYFIMRCSNRYTHNHKLKSPQGRFKFMVGVTGFEPTTSATRTQRSTRLSYTPICAPIMHPFFTKCKHKNLYFQYDAGQVGN